MFSVEFFLPAFFNTLYYNRCNPNCQENCQNRNYRTIQYIFYHNCVSFTTGIQFNFFKQEYGPDNETLYALDLTRKSQRSYSLANPINLLKFHILTVNQYRYSSSTIFPVLPSLLNCLKKSHRSSAMRTGGQWGLFSTAT